MASQTRQAVYILGGIFLAVALWGIVQAVGTFLGLSLGGLAMDPRRGLVVVGCVGGFLLFWALLLWNRSRSQTTDED